MTKLKNKDLGKVYGGVPPRRKDHYFKFKYEIYVSGVLKVGPSYTTPTKMYDEAVQERDDAITAALVGIPTGTAYCNWVLYADDNESDSGTINY